MSEIISQQHRDVLELLNQETPLKEKLTGAHNCMREQFPFLARISVTLYDSATGVLKTYLHSSGTDNPLDNYQTHIDNAPSLKAILQQGNPRVINKMVTFEDDSQEHTRRIGRQGYAASYTLPMFNNGVFFGFIFFNSDEQDVFNEQILSRLDLFGHLISLMVINEVNNIRTLAAAIRTTGKITHLRDAETGSHLDRMSRYCRLIAMELAQEYDLDDEYIEHVFMFSPLHDIGKIGIPDSILLKEGELTDAERQVMNTHPTIGRRMVDELIENFSLKSMHNIDILRNIAQYHHEAVNGKGYPHGLQHEEIPLEARIVAVADVFDALTSKRPYKEAWSNEQAIQTLQELAGETLDASCVEALINNLPQIREIQESFQDNFYA